MSLILKIKNFAKALYFHIGYGLPKCTQEQIDKRYLICLGCEFYDACNKECLQCGCNVLPQKKFLNKLAWADQKCPIDKWGKEI